MANNIKKYVSSIGRTNSLKHRIAALLPILSLLVILVVFWWLKLIGITLAGEAFCGMPEHVHGEECTVKMLICTDGQPEALSVAESVGGSSAISSVAESTATPTEAIDTSTVELTTEKSSVDMTSGTETSGTGITYETAEDSAGETDHVHSDSCYEFTYSCGFEEHIHVESCYSDINADIETSADWEATLADISPGISTAEKIVAVANSQLAYAESELNFTVDSDGVRHGYTRYGEWYGNPYGDWSTMFTSFCLRYAGLEDVPVSAGADAMRVQWEDADVFRTVQNYTPVPGDIVFLDKNENGTADATAVVTGLSDGVLSVIEGDLENKVAETAYAVGDSVIVGYGSSVQDNNLSVMDTSPLADTGTVIAETVDYRSGLFANEGTFVVYSRGSDRNYYAFDGNGNAVQIYIDSEGNITSDVSDVNTLLWSFTASGDTNSYLIQNLSSGRYMHAYPNNGTGVTTAGAYPSTLIETTGGVRIKSNTEYARLSVSDGAYVMTQTESQAAVFSFGKGPTKYAVWLDGTNGGLMGLGGSLDQSYMVEEGAVVKLPEEWQSPDKYSYVLQGWFDIKNNKYYSPGEEITVTESIVFYADWFAETYDVGQNNTFVSDTVSTNSFITTRVFDYNSLFNLRSESASISANLSGHSETWNMVTSGNVPYQSGETLDFIFCDYDPDGDISYPYARNGNNINGDVYPGIYTDELGEILFSTENSFDPATGTGMLGKKYIGEADHLFHFDSDPESDTLGYYYYDSKLNAASYNQKDERFYVYDYLERTADSEKDGGVGAYSDFLPFNSPYANKNGNTVLEYTYDGDSGEYAGVTHYQYDAKYDTYNNTVDNVGTNYWFGMSLDINFYLLNDPGATDANGNYGNKDLYGNDMCFKFSGDDDVWVFVDGQLVLDIGGVHGIENGEINFSTGVITVNGTQTGDLAEIGIKEGEHVLTVYYLERGSSQSNCAIYFNITPRYSLTIQKEDVLTRELLNGAEFTVYSDKECTVPAELWTSKESHDNQEPSLNVFTVEDGSTSMWGLVAGKSYYFKETKPPDAAGYSLANGIICLSLDYRRNASYSVEMIEETDDVGNNVAVSNGYTVHGFRIDEETQEAFIVVTNAYNWVSEVTGIQVMKEWNDDLDHSLDSVTVYMTVTYPTGNTKRIREAVLSADNGWTYTWVNLPKYDEDGVSEFIYGIEEAYVEGYMPTVEKVDKFTVTESGWTEALSFVNGETYILGTTDGYLSSTSATANTLQWVEEETAKTSSLAQWTATVSGSNVVFTNGEGQILSFNNSNNNRYFYVTTGSASSQTMTYNNNRLYCVYNRRSYYMSALDESTGRITTTTSQNSALTLTAYEYSKVTTETDIDGFGYKITNTPLDEETSVTVHKAWDLGIATGVDYEKEQITIRLLANGTDTGRTVTLSFQNGWTDSFNGLPYTDPDGNMITYSVEEITVMDDWIPSYGGFTQSDTIPPTYEVTVTNTYKGGYSAELPSTGGYGQTSWILGGFAVSAGSLVYGYVLRRKRERRTK